MHRCRSRSPSVIDRLWPLQCAHVARSPRPGPRPSLQRLFLTGLLTLLPIWLTWVVVKFVFVLLSGISSPLVVPLSEQIATSFPHYLGWVRAEWIQNTIALLATLLVILAVGVASRRVLGQRLLRWVGAVIKRIPLASIIYDSAKKLLDMLQTEPGSTQRVVLIDFPHRDMKSVGLVTRVIRNRAPTVNWPRCTCQPRRTRPRVTWRSCRWSC